MADGHPHIHNYILAVGVVDNVSQHLPGVQEGIALKETIKNAIA